jgi:PST family polysaccharide transporter
MGVFFVLSDEIIGILFGQKWMPAASIFRGLSFLGAVQSIAVFAGSIFNSQGKTGLAFRIGLFTKPLMITGILLGLFTKGIPGLIAGYTLTGLIAFTVESHYISGLFGKKFTDLIRAVYKEMLLSLAVVAAVYYLNEWLSLEAWQKIVVSLSVGGGLYLGFNALWKTVGYVYVLNRIKKWRDAS